MTDKRRRISAITARFVILGVVGAGLAFMPAAKADEALPTDSQQSALATNLGIYGGDNWDIAVDGDHVYTIANGVPNGFFYSSDAGVNWQRPAGTNDYGSGTAVEVDQTTHAVYVALDGLYKSTDYGVTLTKIANNIGNPLLFAQGKIFATWNDTIYVSSDNGAIFNSVAITGENIMSYAASKTVGTFYAVTRNATSGAASLYISTDSGATWNPVTVAAGVTAYTNVSADPYNANILTLSNDNNLWLSVNAGTTWTKINEAAARSCGNFSVWTSTRWYACAGFSANNGSTWTEMDTHTNVMRGPGKVVVINAADENILYGDCMSGVCKSTDGGLTWRNSLNGITGVNVLAISQTTNKGTVWISSSNGLGKTSNFTSATPDWTWPVLPCDPDPAARCDSSGIGESVWVKPDNADIVLAGSIGGWVYRSVNGTSATPTWTAQIPSVVNLAKFKTGSTNNLRPKYFLSDPNEANTVYLAMYDPIDNNGAVLKSIDAGATWTNMAITDDAPATSLSMSKTGILYVGTGYGNSTTKGIYKYADSAWTKLTGIADTLNINSVMADPESTRSVYATATDGIYKSADMGATWAKIVPTGYHGFGPITVQKSTAPNTLYITAADDLNHGVLLKSSDAGNTWGTLFTGLKSESFTAVLFDGLVAGNKHGVLSLKSKVGYSGTKLSASRVRKNSYVTLSSTLKDVTTKKIIKNSTVKLYYKSGNTWKLKATTKSNSRTGKFSFRVKITKNIQYRLTWTPGSTNSAEYTSSNSKIYSIKLK